MDEQFKLDCLIHVTKQGRIDNVLKVRGPRNSPSQAFICFLSLFFSISHPLCLRERGGNNNQNSHQNILSQKPTLLALHPLSEPTHSFK